MKIDADLQRQKVLLQAAYPLPEMPDHIASAIDLIEQAQDQLAMERRELNAISGSAS